MAVTTSITLKRIALGLNKTIIVALKDGTWRIAQVSIPQTVADEAAYISQNFSVNTLWAEGSAPTAEQQRYIDSQQVLLSDFATVEGLAKTFYSGLTGPQKTTIVNSLTNWGSATAAQKSDALLACVALLFVAVGYLIRLQIRE